VMRRNVYGAMLGGPLRKNKAFFFTSYQGTREANGATDQSLYKDVLITPGLTDDRSAASLMATFNVPFVDPIALKLLNTKLASGQFLIPTPQTSDGLVTGTALSNFHEEQFNTSLDHRIRVQDSVTAKFFLAHAPLFSAISGSNFGFPASLPGFGTHLGIDNRVLSLQEIHTFSPTAVNEALFGYSFIRHDEVPQESVNDSELGIQRPDAGEYPGLPLILLARDQRKAQYSARRRTPPIRVACQSRRVGRGIYRNFRYHLLQTAGFSRVADLGVLHVFAVESTMHQTRGAEQIPTALWIAVADWTPATSGETS